MVGDTEPTAELRGLVEHQLDPGERLVYASWVGRAGQRRGTGRPTHARTGQPVPEAAGPDTDWRRRTRTGAVGGPPGSLADTLDAVLPEPTTLAALVLTDTRLMLMREAPQRGRAAGCAPGLRGALDDFRKQLNNLVSSSQPAPRPIAALEAVWQAPRAALVHAHARWGSFADRVVLGFADASWIALTAPHAKHLAAVLAPR